VGVDKAFSELDTKGDNKISPEELAAFFKVCLLHISVYISVYTSLYLYYVLVWSCRYTDIWELSAFLKDKPAGLLLVEQVRKQPINYYRERGRGRREMMWCCF
jgi:hypothetical protein